MNRKKLIIFGVGALVVVILLVAVFVSIFSKDAVTEEVTLQMWGTFDDPSLYESAIRSYKKEHPHVDIVYRQIPFAEYEDTLLRSFAAGTGPDLWLMQGGWLPKHIDVIEPMPEKIAGQDEPLLTVKEFQEKFVDVARTDLTRGSQIYGLPMYMDSLAMYYNKDLLNSVGITAPAKTWEEFVRQVPVLTQKDSRSNLTRSAAALGTARNINRSTDILMLLMMQSGAQMTNTGNTAATFSKAVGNINVGEIATQFYTDFANQNKPDRYTWNDLQKYSIDSFVDGNTAIMFNYSHHIPTLKTRSARLNFGIAPMPQPEGAEFAVNFPNYWAVTVAKQSAHAEEAWKFAVDLTTTDRIISYLELSNRPSARRVFIDQQKTDPELGPFAVQALTARSWHQVDNGDIEEIFADMIDDINYGRASVEDALKSAENQVNVLMSKQR